MFKKIAALAVTFACVFSFMASATFLDDNPRFVQVGHDDTTESYIDMNTIQSVRYDPPYYIIRATVVTYDYANNTVQGYDHLFYLILFDPKGQKSYLKNIRSCNVS